MQYGNSKDMFKEIGIVDSRLFAVQIIVGKIARDILLHGSRTTPDLKRMV